MRHALHFRKLPALCEYFIKISLILHKLTLKKVVELLSLYNLIGFENSSNKASGTIPC